MLSLQTHDYDGKIRTHFLEFCAPLRKFAVYDHPPNFDRCIQACLDFMVSDCRTWKYPSCKKGVVLLKEDMKNNLDVTDGIKAEFLFCYLFYNLVYEEYPAFYEQLHDIVVSGPCPQGRVKRLFQLCLSIPERLT